MSWRRKTFRTLKSRNKFSTTNNKTKDYEILQIEKDETDIFLRQPYLLKKLQQTNTRTYKKKPRFKDFKAITGSYIGPPISSQIVPASPRERSLTIQFPFYLGAKGEYYDKYYLPLNKKKAFFSEKIKHKKEIPNDNKLLEYSPFPVEKLPPFPDPNSFSDYREFEKSALEWGMNVEEGLGYLQLPEIIGSSYYRPSVQNTAEELVSGDLITEYDQISNGEDVTDESDQEDNEKDNSLTYIRKKITGKSTEDLFSKQNISQPSFKHTLRRDPSSFGDSSWGGFHNQWDSDETFTLTPAKEQLLYDFLSKDPNKNDKKFEHGIKQWLNEEEQWGSTLVPKEPQPEYYKTFEEFERAYRRWSKIICKDVQIMPMHPFQLKKQIKLVPSKIKPEQKKQNERIKKINKKSDHMYLDHGTWRRNLDSRLSTTVLPTHKRINKEKKRKFSIGVNHRKGTLSKVKSSNSTVFQYHIKKMKQKKKERLENAKKKFSNSSYITINDQLLKSISFSSLIRRAQSNSILSKLNHSTLLSLNTNLIKLYNQSKKTGGAIILGKKHGMIKGKGFSKKKSTKLTNFSYENLNLDEKSLKKKNGYSGKVEDIEIEFQLPLYDLKRGINLAKIQYNHNYIERLSKELLNQTRKYNQFPLNSWYEPSKYPPSFHKNKIREAKYISKKFKKVTIYKIIKLIKLKMFLDTFKKFLKKRIPIKLKKRLKFECKNYSELFLNTITPKNFHSILFLLENNNSRLISSKISLVIMSVMLSKLGPKILSFYQTQKKIKQLYFLVLGLSFRNPLIISIYPYDNKTDYLLEMYYGKNSPLSNFCTMVQLYYYLNTLYDLLSTDKGNQTYKPSSNSILRLIDKLCRSICNNLIQLIEEHPNVIEEQIFKCMSSRTSSFSTYFFFIFIQLINFKNEKILRLLKSKPINLIQHLRNLTISKFFHVKTSAQYIWKKMLSENFLDFFVNSYTQDTSLILNDLFADQANLFMKDVKNVRLLKKQFLNKINFLELGGITQVVDEDDNNNKTQIRKAENTNGKEIENEGKNHESENETGNGNGNENGNVNKNKNETENENENENGNGNDHNEDNLNDNEDELYKGFGNFKLIKHESIIKRPNFLTKVLTDFFGKIYQKLPYATDMVTLTDSLLLSGVLLQKIISILELTINYPTASSSCISNFILNMIICLSKLNLIVGVNQIEDGSYNKIGNKVIGGNLTVPKIKIGNKVIMKLFEILERGSNQDVTFQIDILNVIRHLVKIASIQMEIYNDPKFHSKLSNLCSSDNLELNRIAWKTFYQMIIVNNKFTQVLVKDELKGYMEKLHKNLINSANSLHYLAKIFQMSLIEKYRIQVYNLTPRRKNVKNAINSLKKDEKKIIDAIVKKHFIIRFNLILKKMVKEYRDKKTFQKSYLIENNTGMAFVKLVNLYEIINYDKKCYKILNYIRKNQDYNTPFKFLINLLPFDQNKNNKSKNNNNNKKSLKNK
ncbi:sca1 complex scaffold protein scaa [Anaeramoeba flamelloides]|uniref:Sca1 complex scaffold protein scaa n=1 Tax=Anaeramoeba flamelloides TaxID=1746091 RepID=A0ABQ8YFT5_9EUKA|nr:sca1 complex scaffold protein scaa [Anaeramoeba flamelloides]